jgi:hypothetical protein
MTKVIPETVRTINDEGYSRNASCALHLIYTFLLGRTIQSHGQHWAHKTQNEERQNKNYQDEQHEPHKITRDLMRWRRVNITRDNPMRWRRVNITRDNPMRWRRVDITRDNPMRWRRVNICHTGGFQNNNYYSCITQQQQKNIISSWIAMKKIYTTLWTYMHVNMLLDYNLC